MIAEFYKDCEIFITGGSGVVGKAAIEKLLRSADVRKIYILMRSKNSRSVELRLEKIKTSKIFRVLKTQKPNELDKLEAIPGDAVLPNLGITPQYAKRLENVSIFFHCAATVRFNEPLKTAMTLNVGATWEALKFAETLKKLKIFMHVSTFFSNTYLERVEPKFFKSPMDWKFLLDAVQDESKQELFDALTRKIITGFPNTYCFTKNLAESVVNDFRHRLPVAIYRPSIVLFALREPEPGFPPSLMGAMGLFVSVGIGVIKTIYMHDDIHLDITPLDLGTIIMLANAAIAGNAYQSGKVTEIPISICSSRGITPYTFKRLTAIIQDEGIWDAFPFNKSFLIPWAYYTSSRVFYKLLCFTHQIIPSMIGDGLLRLFGYQPAFMEIVRKGYTSLEIMKPFLFNNYQCEGVTNLEKIREITHNTTFEVHEITEYQKNDGYVIDMETNMVKKIREVLLNEDPSTLERAKKVLLAKKVIYNLIRAWLAYHLLRWFYRFILNYVNDI